jgi:UDP-GlcNAc:undecaprenyl-phosphate/decaprenyl-phosphate GlcNAc-1-phosphate transferase
MIVISTVIFLVTLALVTFAIRKIIYVSHKKHLFDEPSENRKIHKASTPNLGGVAIFAIMIFSASIFLPYTDIANSNYILAAAVILFTLGLTDDLVGVDPTKKIWAQLVAAVIITVPGDFRFTSFYGMFGVHDIPYAVSILVSVFFVLFLVNAFNLVDGINCLAGSIALLACLVFAWSFSELQQTGYVFLAMALAGCLAGFLFFNRTPAKIFMGDTGSLFLGFMMAVFAIHFMELNKYDAIRQPNPLFQSAPAIVISLMIIPFFDTLRVFSLRIWNKKSPFHADRNHVHHRLIDLKFSHMQASAILLVTTMAALSLVLLFQQLNLEMIFFILIVFALALNWLLTTALSVRTRKATRITYTTTHHPEISARFAEKPLSQFLEKKELKESLEEV